MSRPDFPGKASPALHLVRHGQSTWNLEGRLQGQTDEAELTDLGRRQGRRVADFLAPARPARLLTSDLVRARQTADIISATTGLVPMPTTLLREVHYGTMEGLTTQQAAVVWESLSRFAADGYGYRLAFSERRLGGGESILDVQARVDALLATPWVTEATGDIVIVTHGDTIRIMLGRLLGDDPDEPVWRTVGNGDVYSVHRSAAGGVGYVRAFPSEHVLPIPQD
jgi:probable phosphoglycerate mutase